MCCRALLCSHHHHFFTIWPLASRRCQKNMILPQHRVVFSGKSSLFIWALEKLNVIIKHTFFFFVMKYFSESRLTRVLAALFVSTIPLQQLRSHFDESNALDVEKSMSISHKFFAIKSSQIMHDTVVDSAYFVRVKREFWLLHLVYCTSLRCRCTVDTLCYFGAIKMLDKHHRECRTLPRFPFFLSPLLNARALVANFNRTKSNKK